MKINISGHHVEITEGIKQSVENKFSKVAKHYPILKLCWVLTLLEEDLRIRIFGLFWFVLF
jgi:ribosome-associated translation inhibitor RaiA